MPGQRYRARSRSRGSWLPRLAGLGVVVLVAGGGAAAYVIMFHPAASHHAPPLPTEVKTNQTVGLIAQSALSASSGHPGNQLVQMLGTGGTPAFSPLSAAAAAAQGSPQWTADQMQGNTFIFIFLPDDRCLAAASNSALALQRCNLNSHLQRWKRVNGQLVQDGHDFFQYANLGNGKCLSQVTLLSQPGGAGLAACSPARPPSQMIAFWWLTIAGS